METYGKNMLVVVVVVGNVSDGFYVCMYDMYISYK